MSGESGDGRLWPEQADQSAGDQDDQRDNEPHHQSHTVSRRGTLILARPGVFSPHPLRDAGMGVFRNRESFSLIALIPIAHAASCDGFRP
tara:strand:- start:57 stop:326 length:270 start_codon:yes stop_codon:yes gene_type:complete